MITAINELLMKGSDRTASFFLFICRHCPDANDEHDLNNLKTRVRTIDSLQKNNQCHFYRRLLKKKKD